MGVMFVMMRRQENMAGAAQPRPPPQRHYQHQSEAARDVTLEPLPIITFVDWSLAGNTEKHSPRGSLYSVRRWSTSQ